MSKTVSFITQRYGKYDPMSIDSYISIGGFESLKKIVKMDLEDILTVVEKSGVKGRGGAAYDLGRKWRQASEVPGESKVVVCNADEGEPCTFKDRSLFENDPFGVLEGIAACCYTVGAQNAYIYLREEYFHLRPVILNAIDQMQKKGLLGKNALGSGKEINIHLYTGAGAYVCGEGTALIESIEGKSGRPRIKPPFIKQAGLFMLPTCVNNVESFAIVPHLFAEGGLEKYLSYGVEGCRGTKIISVAGNVKKPGVFEVPFGITLREIIYDLAGGVVDNNKIRLVQVGGASTGICRPDKLDTPFTYNDLKKAGLSMGSGAVLVVDERTTLAEFLYTTQEFFSHESCGKCTPCREGNKYIRKLVKKFLNKEHTAKDIADIKKYATLMKETAFCGLGDTAQSAMLSAMECFPEEFEVK